MIVINKFFYRGMLVIFAMGFGVAFDSTRSCAFAAPIFEKIPLLRLEQVHNSSVENEPHPLTRATEICKKEGYPRVAWLKENTHHRLSLLWCSAAIGEKFIPPVLADDPTFDEIEVFLKFHKDYLAEEAILDELLEAATQVLNIQNNPVNYLVALELHQIFEPSDAYKAKFPFLFLKSLTDFELIAKMHSKIDFFHPVWRDDAVRELGDDNDPQILVDAANQHLKHQIQHLLRKKPKPSEVRAFLANSAVQNILDSDNIETFLIYLLESPETFQGSIATLRIALQLLDEPDSYLQNFLDERLLPLANNLTKFWQIYDTLEQHCHFAGKNERFVRELVSGDLINKSFLLILDPTSIYLFLREAEKRPRFLGLAKRAAAEVLEKYNFLEDDELTAEQISYIKGFFPKKYPSSPPAFNQQTALEELRATITELGPFANE